MTTAAITAQDLLDYLVHSHRLGYAMIPAMRTVRQLARNDRDLLHEVNDLFDWYTASLPNGHRLIPTPTTVNGLLDALGPDLPSVR
jgi:hypothetical protein